MALAGLILGYTSLGMLLFLLLIIMISIILG